MLNLYLTHMHSCNQPSQSLSNTLQQMKLFYSAIVDLINAEKAEV